MYPLQIALTGALSRPRTYFVEAITARGHVFSPTVKRSTDYLVVGQQRSDIGTSSKERLASSLGVPTLTERQFWRLMLASEIPSSPPVKRRSSTAKPSPSPRKRRSPTPAKRQTSVVSTLTPRRRAATSKRSTHMRAAVPTRRNNMW
jgi:hypothetical protein